ncbi:MAG: HNH endonuclease [Oscillatoriales cyanobacterium C42_A2020_001]|nr:HNH endonuclease [Leptolyngbyaceae cyanobacterium C42_A2020_001]
MYAYSSESLKTQIRERDRHRYCLTSEANNGLPMRFDHIHPQSKGGNTSFENVCLAYRSCNEYKSDLTEAPAPLTGEIVPSFNPRNSGQNTCCCKYSNTTIPLRWVR